MDSIEVKVSDRVNTFLLVSLYKKGGEKLDSDCQVKKIEETIREGIEGWKKTYENKLITVYGLDPEKDKDKIRELCSQKLFFQYKNKEKDDNCSEYFNFSLTLLGRHDFVHLLESPNLVEMSSILYDINRILEEEDLARESENISCVPVDFGVKGNYFLGKDKCWFVEDKNLPKKIEIFKDHIYAIVCIEFKKGMKENDKFLELADFIIRLKKIEKFKKYIKGIFLGFGLHDLILILESRKISDIILTVVNLRKAYFSGDNISIARDTSTIFCTCEEKSEDFENNFSIEYSTLVSVVAGTDISTYKEIRNNEEIHSYVRGETEFFERQGYYDLIISFKPKSHYHAGLLCKELLKIKPVLKISTIVKMKEEDVEKMLEEIEERCPADE